MAVLSGASSTTPTIPTPCRSPAGRLRRCVPPVPTVRRCPTPCLGPLPPARRGYRRRVSTPVVDGTGVDPARPGQGSCPPPCPRRSGTANRVTVRPCPARPARALFVGKPQPEAQRTAQRRQDRRKAAPSAVPKKVAPLSGACERSEVLTARTRSTLQLRAVFRRNAPQKRDAARTACLAGTGKPAPNARTESRAARG